MSTSWVRFFKDTKSIFEMLVSFSFFLKIQRCNCSIIARKTSKSNHTSTLKIWFDHPWTDFPKIEKKNFYIMLCTCTQIFLQNFFEIEQISLETLFKYFSEPPCTYVAKKRKGEKSGRKKIGEGGGRSGKMGQRSIPSLLGWTSARSR